MVVVCSGEFEETGNFVMTFHETWLFPFYCTMHQPAMSGQVLVIAP